MDKTQEQMAREWAERAKDFEVSSPEQQAAADFILANTTKLTMADTVWDPEKHHLAGAVYQQSSTLPTVEVVMIHKDHFDTVSAIVTEWEQPIIDKASKFNLNGKKYKLVEATEHPEVLKSQGEYNSAPLGTVVTKHEKVWVKNGGYWFVTGSTCRYTWLEMAGVERQIMRWGWGDEA